MPNFTDAEGRGWKVRVTLATLRDLEQAMPLRGSGIFELIADPARLRSEIIGRAEVVGKGLYFACWKQAAERRAQPTAVPRGPFRAGDHRCDPRLDRGPRGVLPGAGILFSRPA